MANIICEDFPGRLSYDWDHIIRDDLMTFTGGPDLENDGSVTLIHPGNGNSNYGYVQKEPMTPVIDEWSEFRMLFTMHIIGPYVGVNKNDVPVIMHAESGSGLSGPQGGIYFNVNGLAGGNAHFVVTSPFTHPGPTLDGVNVDLGAVTSDHEYDITLRHKATASTVYVQVIIDGTLVLNTSHANDANPNGIAVPITGIRLIQVSGPDTASATPTGYTYRYRRVRYAVGESVNNGQCFFGNKICLNDIGFRSSEL